MGWGRFCNSERRGSITAAILILILLNIGVRLANSAIIVAVYNAQCAKDVKRYDAAHKQRQMKRAKEHDYWYNAARNTVEPNFYSDGSVRYDPFTHKRYCKGERFWYANGRDVNWEYHDIE